MSETSADVVKRYLQDAITGEKNAETGLAALAGDELSGTAKHLISDCSRVSRHHQEQLESRLSLLGGIVPGKGLFARIFDTAATSAAITGRHGVTRFAEVEIETLTLQYNQIAVYEALASIGEASGDSDTAVLARVCQNENRAATEQLLSILTTHRGRSFS